MVRRHSSEGVRPVHGSAGAVDFTTYIYCAFTPASRITPPQRWRSSRRKSAISAGVSPTAVALMSTSRLAMSGSAIAAATADDSLAAISGGVPGGAAIANQVEA